MTEATLTSKYQITLPKAVREELGVGPGDKLRFMPAWRGYQLVVVRGDISELRGILKGRRKKPLSIAEMNRVIAGMGSTDQSPAATEAVPRRRKSAGGKQP